MKILVISLPSASIRRARMKQMMEHLGLDFQFIDGVVGATLADLVLERFTHRSSWGLSRPELGCLLAHAAAWECVANNHNDATLILEDDVHFSSDFSHVIESLKVDQSTLAVYKLETMLSIVDASTKVAQQIGKRQLRALHSLHTGSAGYILSRKAAKFLLEKLPEMKHPVDIELFSRDVGFASNYVVYQVIPGCVIQDQFCNNESKVGLESSLDSFRPQYKRAKSWLSQNSFSVLIKKPLKNWYLKLYSLIKSKKGFTRIFVDFGR
jgi:glycosyl transferase, family 25